MASRDEQARSMASSSRAGGGGENSGETTSAKGRLARLPGGNKALAAFGISLVSYTLQTEAAQYVQQGLGYRKPLLSLYLGHSGFATLLPAHLLFLTWTSGMPLSHHLHLIAQNLHWQLKTPTRSVKEGEVQEEIRRRLSTYSGRMSMSERRRENGDIESRSSVRARPTSWRDSMRLARPQPVYSTWSEHRFGFDAPKFVLLLLVLVAAITIPALSWYTAVPMTSMADITALYNTFSVWALVFSVWFLGEKWSRYKVLSVIMACGGVVIVAYGGAEHRKKPKELDPVYGKPGHSTTTSSPAPTSTSTTLGSALPTVTEAAVRAVVDWGTSALLQARGGGEAIPPDSTTPTPAPAEDASNPLLGDLLALFAAVTMAAYEMAFKLLGTLPDEDEQKRRYDGTAVTRHEGEVGMRQDGEDEGLLHKIGDEEDETENEPTVDRPSQSLAIPEHVHDERSAIWEGGDVAASGYGSNGNGTPTATMDADRQPDAKMISDRLGETKEDKDEAESVLDDGDADEMRAGSTRLARPRSARFAEDEEEEEVLKAELNNAAMMGTWIPPPLPFGLHANIMTAGIGAVTFATLWIGLVVAHITGWERFEWPHNWLTVFAILFVVVSGIIFNGCFMILLGLWGPVVASISCLLSTVAVAVLDGLLAAHFSLTSALGCLFIMMGFGLLLAEPGH